MMVEEYDFSIQDLEEVDDYQFSLNENNFKNELGHFWVEDWVETNRPHPGFGGSTNITGYCIFVCHYCNIEQSDSKSQIQCPKKIG